MSIQPESSVKLTRSPRTGGSVFDVLYQFGEPEIEAMRRFMSAQDVITDFHIDESHPQYPKLEDASFELQVAIEDFYRERLKRLLPGCADLVEWVIDHETLDQAMEAARAS